MQVFSTLFFFFLLLPSDLQWSSLPPPISNRSHILTHSKLLSCSLIRSDPLSHPLTYSGLFFYRLTIAIPSLSHPLTHNCLFSHSQWPFYPLLSLIGPLCHSNPQWFMFTYICTLFHSDPRWFSLHPVAHSGTRFTPPSPRWSSLLHCFTLWPTVVLVLPPLAHSGPLYYTVSPYGPQWSSFYPS